MSRTTSSTHEVLVGFPICHGALPRRTTALPGKEAVNEEVGSNRPFRDGFLINLLPDEDEVGIGG